MRATFQGSIVAMVTPFRNGKIDEPKVKELVELHVKSGTDAIVPCGTTGESPTLSHDEHRHMVELTVEAAAGRIPVIANIVPRETSEMVHAALDGDWKRARELHYKLFPLARAAFLETNPIPIKEAMGMVGMLEPEFRLPMCRMGDANREKLRAILTAYGLVK